MSSRIEELKAEIACLEREFAEINDNHDNFDRLGAETELHVIQELLRAARAEMSRELEKQAAFEIETLDRMVEYMDQHANACSGIEHWREDMLKKIDALYAGNF